VATNALADTAITDMVTNEYLSDQVILAKLAEVEADPNTKWLAREEVFGPIRERFGYEV